MPQNQSQFKSLQQYKLFIYREELQRRNCNALSLTTMKIDLTNELITECCHRVFKVPNDQDIQIIKRQLSYKESLLQQQWILSGGLTRFIESANIVRDYEWSDLTDKVLEQIDIGPHQLLKCSKMECVEMENESEVDDVCMEMEMDIDVDVADVKELKFECDWSNISNMQPKCIDTSF